MASPFQIKFTLGLLIAGVAAAQELEPRAYSPSPVGTTFVGTVFGRSSGGVSFDAAVPITGARATLYFQALGVAQTFGLFGRQALAEALLPYVWGNASGNVGEQVQRITRSGLANVALRFSVNLHGSPALTPRSFAATPHRNPIVGASLAVSAPTGQYDRARLVNLGTNRWSLKPELGLSYPVRKFYLDLYAGALFFTENTTFFPGNSTKSQEPLILIQGHVSYTVRPRLWLAFDSIWYGGGAISVNHGPPFQRLNNSRVGGTVSLPFTEHQSLKITYSTGATGRLGTNFTTVKITWQYFFYDRP